MDPVQHAIAMYIVISQLVYGPAIETAAETINKLVNTHLPAGPTRTTRWITKRLLVFATWAPRLETTSSATTSFAMPWERLSM